MRLPTFILPTTVFLAIVGAFAAGHYIGQIDAQKAGAAAMHSLDASRSAEAFFAVSNARQALRESKPEHVELVLVRYAALHASALLECSSSPSCVAWVGGRMPTKAQLEEVRATERAMNGKL
jgi:hypothetical protein